RLILERRSRDLVDAALDRVESQPVGVVVTKIAHLSLADGDDLRRGAGAVGLVCVRGTPGASYCDLERRKHAYVVAFVCFRDRPMVRKHELKRIGASREVVPLIVVDEVDDGARIVRAAGN